MSSISVPLPLCRAVTSAHFQSVGMRPIVRQSLKSCVIAVSSFGEQDLMTFVGSPGRPGPLVASRLLSVFFTMSSVTVLKQNLDGVMAGMTTGDGLVVVVEDGLGVRLSKCCSMKLVD